MFGTAKPAASLSSGLLARKGQAKPAMRPQGYVGYPGPETPIEDLGWNDMGDYAQSAPTPAPVTAHTPVTEQVPEVVRQREALAAELAQPKPIASDPETPVALRPVSVKTAERLQRETRHKNRKAAFTLRLDEERHLKLRLASALHHASAQQLVTMALDNFLNAIPEVETLVAQLPPPGKGR